MKLEPIQMFGLVMIGIGIGIAVANLRIYRLKRLGIIKIMEECKDETNKTSIRETD